MWAQEESRSISEMRLCSRCYCASWASFKNMRTVKLVTIWSIGLNYWYSPFTCLRGERGREMKREREHCTCMPCPSLSPSLHTSNILKNDFACTLSNKVATSRITISLRCRVVLIGLATGETSWQRERERVCVWILTEIYRI